MKNYHPLIVAMIAMASNGGQPFAFYSDAGGLRSRRTHDDQCRRIEAAEAKRELRKVRNLRLAAGGELLRIEK